MTILTIFLVYSFVAGQGKNFGIELWAMSASQLSETDLEEFQEEKKEDEQHSAKREQSRQQASKKQSQNKLMASSKNSPHKPLSRRTKHKMSERLREALQKYLKGIREVNADLKKALKSREGSS